MKVGDKVSEGTVILMLEGAARRHARREAAARSASRGCRAGRPSAAAATAPTSGAYETIEVRVPDIGDFTDVPVIEVLVSPGDRSCRRRTR